MHKGSIISLTVSVVLSAALAISMVSNMGQDNPRGESMLVEKVVTVVVIAPLLAAFVFCISLLLRGRFAKSNTDWSGASIAQGFLYLAWSLLVCASIYFWIKSEQHLRDAERHFQDAEKTLDRAEQKLR